LAYTIPSTNEIVNCPLYYSALPALTSTCHAQDQATTTLHEMTHAPGKKYHERSLGSQAREFSRTLLRLYNISYSKHGTQADEIQ